MKSADRFREHYKPAREPRGISWPLVLGVLAWAAVGALLAWRG